MQHKIIQLPLASQVYVSQIINGTVIEVLNCKSKQAVDENTMDRYFQANRAAEVRAQLPHIESTS